MTLSRRAVAPVLLGLTICLAGAGCSAPTGEPEGGAASPTGTVTIGLLAPLTGASAADGKLMEQGTRLAVEELNADGGVEGRQLQVQVADVKDQKSDAVSAAVARLVADPEVAVVVTGYASTTNFEIDTLAEAGMPYIIGGGSAQTAEIISKDPAKYPGIWSVTPSYDAYGTDLPERLQAWDADGTYALPNEKAYLINSDNPYSNGISDGLKTTFAKLGWSVTGPDTVPFGEVNDWTTQIAKVRQVEPALIVNTDYQTSNSARFLTQFRQNPTDSLVFLQYAPSVPEFLELAGDKADGVLYNLLAGPILSEKNERATEVVDAFEKAYDAEPGTYGVSLYEQVMLWAQAAEEVGDPSARAEVGAAIGKLSVDTAMGRITFDQETHLAVQGDEGVPLQLFQIQDGKRVLISPEEFATGTFVKPSWIG